MKLFDLTSGIIAAILVVLGTSQNVETPQVQDKPVVEETETVTTGTFIFTGGSDWTNPEAYEYSPSAPPCLDGEELCAIDAPIVDPNVPDHEKRPVIAGDLQDELEDIQNLAPQDREPTDMVFLKN